MNPATEPLTATPATEAGRAVLNLDWMSGLDQDRWHRQLSDLIVGAEAEARAAALREVAALPEGRETVLRRLLEWIAARPIEQVGRDWACVDCRPSSHVLVDGFLCMVHKARAALRGTPPEVADDRIDVERLATALWNTEVGATTRAHNDRGKYGNERAAALIAEYARLAPPATDRTDR